MKYKKYRNKKCGLFLIILGVFLPFLVYPFTTLNPTALILSYYGKNKPSLLDRRILLKSAETHYEPKKYESQQSIVMNIAMEHEETDIAIQYKYILFISVSIVFVGVMFYVFPNVDTLAKSRGPSLL